MNLRLTQSACARDTSFQVSFPRSNKNLKKYKIKCILVYVIAAGVFREVGTGGGGGGPSPFSLTLFSLLSPRFLPSPSPFLPSPSHFSPVSLTFPLFSLHCLPLVGRKTQTPSPLILPSSCSSLPPLNDLFIHYPNSAT